MPANAGSARLILRGGPRCKQAAVIDPSGLERCTAWSYYRWRYYGIEWSSFFARLNNLHVYAQQYATLAQLIVQACGSVIGQYRRARTAISTFCSRAIHGLRRMQAVVQDDDP